MGLHGEEQRKSLEEGAQSLGSPLVMTHLSSPRLRWEPQEFPG